MKMPGAGGLAGVCIRLSCGFSGIGDLDLLNLVTGAS